VVSQTVLILAAGTAVFAIIFGLRRAAGVQTGGATVAARSDGAETSPEGRPSAPDVAGVVALPPLIYLGFLAAAAVLEAIVPLSVAASFGLARYLAGAALVIAGFAIIFAAARRFRAAGTNIPTDLPTTALVVEGIYRRSRNPLYLAMTLVYSGLGVAAGSLWAIVLLVPLLWIVNTGVIAREERYLERKFGDRYRDYKSRVRRWV
jgi:protein-S-isoprenylcysteine O-methyltransferase Ste14